MTRFSTLPVRVERGLIDGNSGVFFPLPRQLGSIRRAAADRAVRRLMILFISVTSLDGGAVLSGERPRPYIYNRYYKAKTKCTYRAVIPQSAKPLRHGYSMQAKAPPHDMRGDFAIASEGIASRLRYPLGSI